MLNNKPELRRGLAMVLAAGSLLSASQTAGAGTIANGAWAPTGCGAQPVAPVLDLKNIETYNSSVEAVNVYRKAIKAYLDCAVGEGNSDIQAIRKSAGAAQQQARDDNERIASDIKAADAKFR